jgi:protein-disulfide isomerase
MNIRYIVTGIILTIFLIAGVVFLRKTHGVKRHPERILSESKSKGPADAPVQIIEYSDFQCPACRTAIPTIDEILAAYPGRIRFAFHHFPLPGHPFSPLAHQAAECAADRGKFWEYHDRLYSEQPNWTILSNPTEVFLRYAKEGGLDLDAFAQCLTEDRIRRRIFEERAQGESLQVRSTPTFFINGERLVGPVELKIKGEAKIREILGIPPGLQTQENKP